MPRDLPLGNGSLLVAFDKNYCIRDLYWPHVGKENHAIGHPFRVGVWVEDDFRWFEDRGWRRELAYSGHTLVTEAKLEHPDLGLRLEFYDAVDFHEDLFIRRIEVSDLSDRDREVRLFFHHDFHIAGNAIGDTAYYEPERRSVIHYKSGYWFMINGSVPTGEHELSPGFKRADDSAPGTIVGVHQWACGIKETAGHQGTWRDAEDGRLSGNAVAHGSVDSCVGFSVRVPAGESQSLWVWMAVAADFDALAALNRKVRRRGAQSFLDRTRGYWNLWIHSHRPDMGDLPKAVQNEYLTSLLVVRTQMDNNGAIVAANDSDISEFARDTYSYVWPRDGALVAHSLDLAGYINLPREFFRFCDRVLTREGYFLHKYNPDSTLASSWHPWYQDGEKHLPIQEDETALVLWALWGHFEKFGDVEFVKPYYRRLICNAADFLVAFRDPETGLPKASYGLWEERHGVLSWTLGAVWGGLAAAVNFSQSFGEVELAKKYRQAAEEIKQATEDRLWLPEKQHFARLIRPQDDAGWQVDDTLDASVVGLWKFGMFRPDHPKIVATMHAIQSRLWVKTGVGGVARYENDYYHQVSQDLENVPGNPWFICTLWLAEWYAEVARDFDELDRAVELLEWTTERALPSGILAEQVNPDTGEPLSVSPLTWSHATYVSAVHAYLNAVKRLSDHAGQRSSKNAPI